MILLNFCKQFMKVIICGKFLILNSASLWYKIYQNVLFFKQQNPTLGKCFILETYKYSFELFFQSKNVCQKREHKKIQFYLKILQLYRNNEDDFWFKFWFWYQAVYQHGYL